MDDEALATGAGVLRGDPIHPDDGAFDDAWNVRSGPIHRYLTIVRASGANVIERTVRFGPE